jgi:hypothetical protein
MINKSLKLKSILILSGSLLAILVLSLFAPKFLVNPKLATKEKNIRGITLYNPITTYPGLNLFSFAYHQSAYLMDLKGKFVYSWATPLSGLNYSESKQQCFYKDNLKPWPVWRCGWQAITTDKQMNLYVVAGTEVLAKLDSKANLIWKLVGSFHSDIDLDPKGNVYTIEKSYDTFRIQEKDLKIIDEFIVKVSSSGKITERVSVLSLVINDLFEIAPETVKAYQSGIKIKTTDPFDEQHRDLTDLLHVNGVKVIDQNIEGICRKGDVLISIRNLNTVAILDLAQRKIVWKWGKNQLKHQHNPTLLKNGHILIFDNRDGEDHSRVVEIDPMSPKIVWNYEPRGSSQFYSSSKGGAQRLPNGNTLITSAHEGRIFEIDTHGNVVWNYFSPLTKGPSSIETASIPVRAEKLLFSPNLKQTHSNEKD